jgi:hypothetical protein
MLHSRSIHKKLTDSRRLSRLRLRPLSSKYLSLRADFRDRAFSTVWSLDCDLVLWILLLSPHWLTSFTTSWDTFLTCWNEMQHFLLEQLHISKLGKSTQIIVIQHCGSRNYYLSLHWTQFWSSSIHTSFF